MMGDWPEWFAPKRRGFGAGLPIAWQGWAVLAAFCIIVGIALAIFGPDDLRALSIVLPAIAGLTIIIARTIKGGMRWRWEGDAD